MKLLLFIMAFAISHVVFTREGAEEDDSINWWDENLTELNTPTENNGEDTEIPPEPFEDDSGDIPPIEDDEGFGIWEPVDLTILNTDSDYRKILNLGVEHIIAETIQYKILPFANYYLEDVLSIKKDEIFGDRFTILLGDGQGKEIIISFGIFEDSDTGERYLANYRFGVDSGDEEPPVGIWEAVDETELDTNQDLNDSLNYGIQEVINKGIELSQLSTPDYHWSEIYSIKRQAADDGMHYRFNLKLQNDQGGYAHVIFVVLSPSEGQRELLPSYLFLDIQNAGSQPNEETNEEVFVEFTRM